MRPGIKNGTVTRIEDAETDTYGFVAYNDADKEIVIAFRGTNGLDIKNWMMNLHSERVPYEMEPGALVHLGWYNAYKTIKESVIRTVQEHLKNHSKASILITGHSLGGVLATFTAIDIKRMLKPKGKI